MKTILSSLAESLASLDLLIDATKAFSANAQLTLADQAAPTLWIEATSTGLIALLGLALFLHRLHAVRTAPQNPKDAPLDALRRFGRLQRKSKCPFARRARLRGATLSGDGSLESRIRAIIPPLLQFVAKGYENKLDGFIIHLPVAGLAHNLDAFSVTLNRVLRALASADPTGHNCFSENVTAPAWQFSFGGVRFFVTTFAPFYGPRHSRFSHVPDSAFIYLQPEYSFDFHGISERNPHRQATKARIRQEFKVAGMPYDVDLVTQPIEAFKYLKPLVPAESPVEWWKR